MTGPMAQGVVAPGSTPAEVAAYIAALPSFASDPAGHVSSATARAMTAHEVRRAKSARFFTHLAALLVAAAGNPAVQRGVVLVALVRIYGEPAGPA